MHNNKNKHSGGVSSSACNAFIAYYFCLLQNLKEEFSNGVIYFVRKL